MLFNWSRELKRLCIDEIDTCVLVPSITCATVPFAFRFAHNSPIIIMIIWTRAEEYVFAYLNFAEMSPGSFVRKRYTYGSRPCRTSNNMNDDTSHDVLFSHRNRTRGQSFSRCDTVLNEVNDGMFYLTFTPNAFSDFILDIFGPSLFFPHPTARQWHGFCGFHSD